MIHAIQAPVVTMLTVGSRMIVLFVNAFVTITAIHMRVVDQSVPVIAIVP